MPATGVYDTVKSTSSSMDDAYEHVIEYKPYGLSMLIVFTLKHIMDMSTYVFGGNKEHKNSALNVVDVASFS